MHNYFFIIFLLLFGLWLARFNTAYHPNKLFKRHINIKNPRLQKLLIWQSDPFGGHNYNKKAYRGKMTVHGICLYVVWLFLLVFSICFWVFGPQTPIETMVVDDFWVINRLNEGVVVLSNAAYISFAVALWLLNVVRSREVDDVKFVKAVCWLVTIGTFVIGLAMVIETFLLFI